jgi:hypothetical protein
MSPVRDDRTSAAGDRRSFAPPALGFVSDLGTPPLKRWAIFGRSCGTLWSPRRSRDKSFFRQGEPKETKEGERKEEEARQPAGPLPFLAHPGFVYRPHPSTPKAACPRAVQGVIAAPRPAARSVAPGHPSWRGVRSVHGRKDFGPPIGGRSQLFRLIRFFRTWPAATA